ncbi:hypothetical protein PRIEUP_LOCUS1961 [Pristimantis euphronides]
MDIFLWSDHEPVLGAFSRCPSSPTGGTWRLNDNLLNDPHCLSDLKDTIASYGVTHAADPTPDPIKWEALKCVLRGILISHGSRLKKDRSAWFVSLLRHLSVLEDSNKRKPLPQLAGDISETRQELLKVIDQKSLQARTGWRGIFFEYGNKSGRLLARTLHPRPPQATIMAINFSKGVIRTTENILEEFRNYYESLYNIQGKYSSLLLDQRASKIQKYLSTLSLPALNEGVRSELEEDFTITEVKERIKHLKTGKSPGPDGFTPSFYKLFTKEFCLWLLNSFQEISRGCPFPSQVLMAHIAVIPKVGKDRSACSNYRPIPLINLNVKLFAKLIALRVGRHVSGLIHSEQVGFVPGREARDNTIKTMSLVSLAREMPVFIVSRR